MADHDNSIDGIWIQNAYKSQIAMIGNKAYLIHECGFRVMSNASKGDAEEV